jgi:hypothetical protein
MHELPKGGRPPGLLRTVLKRDLRERPVKTEPFGRWREAQEDIAGRTLWAPQPSRPAADTQSPPSGGSSEKSGDLLKQAILLGSQMALSEARRMLAMKARQVSLTSPRKKPE